MELLSGTGLLICGFLISFFMVSLFMAARKESRKAPIAEPEQNRFVYHYCASYIDGDGIKKLDGMVSCLARIKTAEDYTALRKSISPDLYDKLTIYSLSFLGMEKEGGMAEEIDSNGNI